MKIDMPITKVEQNLAAKRSTRLYRTWKFRGFKRIINICCEQKTWWV